MMNYSRQERDYAGKRALMLLRVSTPEQEKGFGWPAQEKEIRRKIIEPLGLRLDENRHIIRDTYTGLEFRNRPVLDEILEMASRREFDILVTDVLDRLGRKGLERELYRMQLKDLNVRILTTDPNEHADDDSLTGELIRLINGHSAEQELNNIRRRTMNGRRTKLEGDPAKGEPPKVLGNGARFYGYKYALDERSKRIGLILNEDVIKVDEDGTDWTEVKVVAFVFESAIRGMTLHKISEFLDSKGIPCPAIAKGLKNTRLKYPLWHPHTLSRFLRQSAYWGEARYNKYPVAEKEPGRKSKARRKTSEEEQIIVPVPAIVTKEQAEQALKKVSLNQMHATRNNPNFDQALLRAGLAKCGLCGRTMRVAPNHKQTQRGNVVHLQYRCQTSDTIQGACKGCTIQVSILDRWAWEKAREIIKDPKEIDERVAKERKKDPTAEQRKRLNTKLKEIRDEQSALQDYLSEKIRKRTLDAKTEARLNQDLRRLAKEEEDCVTLLAKNEDEHDKWEKVEKKLNELHQRCAEIREQMGDPDYEPTYKEKRDLLIFLGITAIVFRQDHKPRVDLQSGPPDIVSLLSSGLDRWS